MKILLAVLLMIIVYKNLSSKFSFKSKKNQLLSVLDICEIADDTLMLIVLGLRADSAFLESLKQNNLTQLYKKLTDKVDVADDIITVLIMEDVPIELQNLAQLVVDSVKNGANISYELRSFSQNLRNEYISKVTINASKASVKLLFPIIFIYLPAFMLITVVPVLLNSLTQINF
mgnify:CR=1 FL=1